MDDGPTQSDSSSSSKPTFLSDDEAHKLFDQAHSDAKAAKMAKVAQGAAAIADA